MTFLPPRPETPALDALWHAHDVGASRYREVHARNGGATVVDDAMRLYDSKLDYKNDPIDAAELAAIPAEQVQAARDYLTAVRDAENANAGFLPGEGKNETPILQSAVQEPAQEPPAAPVVHEAVPVAIPIPVAAPVAEHHASVWHSIASYVTPENVADVLSLLSSFKQRKH